MIKINLLPTKRKPPKKVTELQKQIIIAAVVLAGTGGGMGFYFLTLNAQIASKQQEKTTMLAKIAEQDNKLKDVKNVEEERKKVTEKIGVIEQLKKNQQGPVRLLDELSKAIPVSVDITSMVESGGTINLVGEAFTNDDIVKFVDNLKASPFFADVFLQETSQATAEGYEIYKYKLSFRYKGL
jgi:type IV pilus assembly protein PilN